MKNDHLLEKEFVKAVNTYITVINQDMIAYGLEESALWPFIETISEQYADDELIYRLQAYSFPDNTPHRHLFFLKEFKENDEYIAFGENTNYNSTYVIEKKTGKVLSFSEHEVFLASCAIDLSSFLKAFTVMINLEIAHIQKKKITNPLTILNSAVTAAGGEQYRPFYEFIFPIDLDLQQSTSKMSSGK